MKNKITFFAFFMLAVSTMLTSCSSDDDATPLNSETSLLVNKWWYDSNDFAGDVYFNSNGNYEQVVNLMGNTIESEGNWAWEDETNGIIKITNLTNNGVSTLWFKISDLTENSVSIEQSIDGGETYFTAVFFVDTDN